MASSTGFFHSEAASPRDGAFESPFETHASIWVNHANVCRLDGTDCLVIGQVKEAEQSTGGGFSSPRVHSQDSHPWRRMKWRVCRDSPQLARELTHSVLADDLSAREASGQLTVKHGGWNRAPFSLEATGDHHDRTGWKGDGTMVCIQEICESEGRARYEQWFSPFGHFGDGVPCSFRMNSGLSIKKIGHIGHEMPTHMSERTVFCSGSE